MDARYRLAPMREVRTRETRVRQGDLSGAVGDARLVGEAILVAADRVAMLRAALGDATAARAQALAEGAQMAAVVGRERHLARLRGDLAGALDELARAEASHLGQLAAVDAARARLVHARAEREVIERHFAAWRARQRKRAERRED